MAVAPNQKPPARRPSMLPITEKTVKTPSNLVASVGHNGSAGRSRAPIQKQTATAKKRKTKTLKNKKKRKTT